MNPLKVSAQYAAFVWFSKQHPHQPRTDANHFARQHWDAFLACAHEGIGRLLMQIAAPQAKEVPLTGQGRSRLHKQTRPRQLPMAC